MPIDSRATRRKLTRTAATLLALLSLAPGSPATAHDFWIEPGQFRPAVGQTVPLQLFVGQHFKGESVIYLPGLFTRYAVIGPRGEQPVSAVAGDDPAGAFAPTVPGLHIVAYRGTEASVTFDTREEFERYLEMEGLERVRELPAFGRKSRPPIREHYARCAKSLIAADSETRPGGEDRALGLTLELIAERNPYALGAGEELPVRLLHEGRALAGALVIAFNKRDSTRKLKARTDVEGRVRIKVDAPGRWLVTSVHMTPAPFYARHDWDSLWASLTFERP